MTHIIERSVKIEEVRTRPVGIRRDRSTRTGCGRSRRSTGPAAEAVLGLPG